MTEAESANSIRYIYRFGVLDPFFGWLNCRPLFRLCQINHYWWIMMGVGYCLMGIHSLTMLYVAMTLVILGNGFFKPNISTLLGNIYSTPEHEEKKDDGYNIFYMDLM